MDFVRSCTTVRSAYIGATSELESVPVDNIAPDYYRAPTRVVFLEVGWYHGFEKRAISIQGMTQASNSFRGELSPDFGLNPETARAQISDMEG